MSLPKSLRQRLFLEEAFDARDGWLVVEIQIMFHYLGSYKAFEFLPLYHSRTQKENHAVHVATVDRANSCFFHVEAHLVPPLLQVPVVSASGELGSLEVFRAAAPEVSEQLLVWCVEPQPSFLLGF